MPISSDSMLARRQAYIMAFSDALYLLGSALIVAIAAMLLRKPEHLEASCER